MISFDQAFEIVMNSARQGGTERVALEPSLNRILAERVKSDMDMPPFNKSAMDGYACRREDLGNQLAIIETIPAGCTPKRSISQNQCSKIMTGAMVPEGADCVIMVEFTENPTDQTVRFTGQRTADNICLKGEDVHAGDIVLDKGQKIGPQHIAILASVGLTRPLVASRPKVGIIATGNELVEPAAKPGNSQIRNSNSYQLFAQVTNAGAIPCYYGIAKDTEQDIDGLLKKAMVESQVILISGGVSMGDLDLVPDVLRKNQIKLIFEKIAIKPGKPTVFGVSSDVFCFGLPGNPVSTFVLFELLVKPFLLKMMGQEFKPCYVSMLLDKSILRRRTKRQSWMPVAFTSSRTVMPVEYHGSAHINALCTADGLISVPVGVGEIKQGSMVQVRQI